MFKKTLIKPNKLENIAYYLLSLVVFSVLVLILFYSLDKELENQEKYNIEQAKQYCSVNQCN